MKGGSNGHSNHVDRMVNISSLSKRVCLWHIQLPASCVHNIGTHVQWMQSSL